MAGMADYEPSTESMGERWHIVGKTLDPILICRKKEIPGLFSDTFWSVFEIWKYFHYHIDLPDVAWRDVDPEIIDAIINMENHFEKEFSTQAVMIKYQEAILKSLHALAGVRR